MSSDIPVRAPFWYEKRPFSPTIAPFQTDAAPSRTCRRPSGTKGTILPVTAPFKADTAPIPPSKAPSVTKGCPFRTRLRHSKQIRRPSRRRRRPFGTKNVLFAHGGALLSRYGAPPASKCALLVRASALLLTTAPFEANTGRRASDTKSRPFCL